MSIIAVNDGKGAGGGTIQMARESSDGMWWAYGIVIVVIGNGVNDRLRVSSIPPSHHFSRHRPLTMIPMSGDQAGVIRRPHNDT
jgi:hypothetical protein